jgi:tetratricopeptide (TPR) repeat protein
MKYDVFILLVISLFFSCQTSPKTYIQFSEIYMKGGHYDNALNELNRGIEEYPENTDLLYSRGVLYTKISDFENALTDFIKVIEYDDYTINYIMHLVIFILKRRL